MGTSTIVNLRSTTEEDKSKSSQAGNKSSWKGHPARAPLHRKHTELIPDDAEIRHWSTPQIDAMLLEWLVDNADDKLARRSIKLLLASTKMIPAGVLPDDDALLAKCAGYGNDVGMWLKVKDRVLNGIWFIRPDGCWQCAALTEAINKKMRRPPSHPGSQSQAPGEIYEGDAPF